MPVKHAHQYHLSGKFLESQLQASANSTGDHEPLPLCLRCLAAEVLLLLRLPAHGGAWGVAGHLRCLLLLWIWSCDGTSYPPLMGSLSIAPSTCDTSQPAAPVTAALASLAFWAQVHEGSALIIVGNKQAWAQLKSYSIALSVALRRNLNSWCNKADGQNHFDLGQIEIRRKKKAWNFPNVAADSQLVMIPFTNNSKQ